MDASTDNLSETRLADDGGDEIADSVVDCSTMPRCRHSTSLSSVSAEVRSSSNSPHDDGCLTENVDDAVTSQAQPCRSAADDVEPTTTTSTSTSVPLLEQLVSSPCDVVTAISASSAAVSSSALTAASDSDGQSNLTNSFLQKLESFVSSVGQVTTTAPLTSWMRRPVFPSRSGADGGVPLAARRPDLAGISPFSLPAFFPSPSAADSSRPLDLSSKRIESSLAVNNTPSSQRRHFNLIPRGSGQGEVEGRFVDMSEVKTNSANSLACLERDFGEHSAILTRLGSSRDRQRQSAVPRTTRGSAASRLGRTAMMPGLSAAAHTPVESRICPPANITTSRAELHPSSLFIANSRRPLNGGRTGVVGSKLDPRHPMMPMTTAATVLRCLQCGRTFFSLPELTLHMIQSAHYANLICAAAAYSDYDDEVSVVMNAYNSRQSSNVSVDRSIHRSEPLQLSRGKGLTEMTDAHRDDHLYRSSNNIRRHDCVDAAVSPARSLDDESVSSAGLTETESLRSPTSTGSPTSPSNDNVGSGDDDLTIMSHLLRLQPLLSRTILDNAQTGSAVRGHVDWTGLAAAEERHRQLVRGRSLRTSMQDRSPATDSLPMDLRNQRADGSRYKDSQSRKKSCLPAAAMSVTSCPSSSVYLEKLLDDVRGYRKSLCSGIKRSTSSKWYNGKHRTKKHRAYSISSSDCDQSRYDGPRLNGDRSTMTSTAATTSGEVCLQKHDDGIHGCREITSNVEMSQPVNHEHHSSRRQQVVDSSRRSASKDAAIQPVVDGNTTGSPALSVSGRNVDVPTASGRGLRRSNVDKDHSEYAARFGKYYRLAQELSNKSD